MRLPALCSLCSLTLAASFAGVAWAQGVPSDEAVVTGTRTERRHADSPVATEVITRADIEASGAENLATVLEEQAGVDVTRANASGANVRLQGLDPQYVLILVNGERVGGRVNGAVDLTRFPLEDIQRIEIVRGPSSALYGADAIGGVINLVTRRASRPWEAELHARQGAYDTVDATARAATLRGPVSLDLAGGYHRRDAFDLDPRDAATSGGAFDAGNASVRLDWRPSSRATLGARAEWFLRGQRAVDTGPGGAVFDRRNLTETLSAALTASVQADDATRVRASLWYTLYRDQYLSDQRGSDELDQYQQTRNHIANASVQVDRAFGERHLATVGAEGYFERLDADRLRNGAGQRYRAAVFVQDQWAVLDRPALVVVPGVRVDVDSQFGVAPTPKVQVRLDPRPGLALRFSFGVGFRAPTFQELLLTFENPTANYLVTGNPDLRPETSRSFNAGAEWRAARALWLSLNLYRNDIDGLISTVADVGPPGAPTRYRYRNIASAWTMGAELSARLRPADGVVVDVGYTLTATRDEALDRPLEGRALHRGNVGLQLRHAATGFEASGRVAVVGPRPFYDTPGVPEAPPYASLDLRAAWSRWRSLTVFLGCDNVLDAGDPQVLRLPPRTLYAGVTLRH
jgi:outer membrane receptor for ferrienterochelin and colicins